ncbi:hypothetical protein GGX14DRAFT_667733 [Mycena pura]|uniref:Uncharacterized protein n=1 Tax=Mycena pura TaxID=153505 RepID=A0AAD6UXV4_9AGAR|nr:hypothetical protein GGX14DRAFT_667733 [Mycena pura]
MPSEALPPLPAEDQEPYDDLLRWLGRKATDNAPDNTTASNDDHDNPEADEPPRKKQKTGNDAWDDETAPSDAILAARYFRCAIHPHLKMRTVFLYGTESAWGICTASLSNKQRCKRAPFITAFDALLRHVPQLVNVLRRLYALRKRGHWEVFIDKFASLANSTRANDSTGIKPNLQELIVPNPDKDVLVPPVGGRGVKDKRGWRHEVLQLLLMGCPDRECFPLPVFNNKSTESDDTRTQEQLKRAEQILDDIIASKYACHEFQFPSFLYADNSFNEDDPREGFCRGEMLIRILRHLWTTPRTVTSGLGEKAIPPDANATKHHVYKVIEPMVGYAACHGLVAMMPGDWNNVAGNKELYDRIIKVFHDSPLWAKRTLEFLTSEVFEGASADSDSNTAEQAHPDRGTANDHMAKMAELARLECEAATDDIHLFIINALCLPTLFPSHQDCSDTSNNSRCLIDWLTCPYNP